MKEKALWRAVSKNLSDDCRTTRIESSTQPGIADVFWCWKGFNGWLELKVLQQPVRASTCYDTRRLTEEQEVWLGDTQRSGTSAMVLAQGGNVWMLVPAGNIHELRSLGNLEVRARYGISRSALLSHLVRDSVRTRLQYGVEPPRWALY